MATYRRFTTYLIAAGAVALVVLGLVAIGLYADARPTGTPTPSATITVTNPTETVTKPAPRRPARVETKTETVPGPTVTVTETVEVPAPTVTVTETVTATPTEDGPLGDGTEAQVDGVAYVPPMVLNVDTMLDPRWKIERAARIWNDALGCKVFTTKVPAKVGELQQLYWITETRGLTLAGEGVWALHTPGWPQGTIEFDPSTGIKRFIAVHELGHALGLHHGHGAGSIMNVELHDRELPSAADIAQAKRLQVQAGRCAA